MFRFCSAHSVATSIHITMSNLLEIVVDSVAYLDSACENEDMTKSDVCDSMRNRMCVIMSKLVAYPVCTNFSFPVGCSSDEKADNESLRDFFM